MIDVEKMIYEKYPKLKKNKIIRNAISKFANSVIHQKEINEFLKKNSHLGSYEFIDEVLDYFDFNYFTNNKDLENIPSSGRVVIIANHPLGGLDALSLIKLISKVRKDIKVVANNFLKEFAPLAPLLIDINAFTARQKKESIRKINDALEDEMAVIIFPSGEVSRAGATGVKDKRFKKGFLKFAHRSSSPILPLHIGGKNSKTFYSVSTVNKKLSTLLLPHEMFKQKGNSIEIIIGEIIPHKHIAPQGIPQATLLKLYKKHIYGLKKRESYFLTQKAIAHPEDPRLIKKELKKTKLLGETKDKKKIYLYSSDDPNSIIINEIGRLREISFRKVGEGVNKKRDIDKYDRYYKHIILWDDEDLEIVGAYRIAECKEIIKEKGVNALYATTLFSFNDTILPYLDNAIELGRSFIQPKYWGSRALDYLWYGIGAYLKNNPQIKYMFGPLSLSNSYSQSAKDMLLYFYETHFHDKENLVSAKIPYNFKRDKILISKLKNEFKDKTYKENFKILKKLLNTIFSNIPTLYKQYAQLCEKDGIRFCAYNIDPDFSNCIDSFIFVEIEKIKDTQKRRYIMLND